MSDIADVTLKNSGPGSTIKTPRPGMIFGPTGQLIWQVEEIDREKRQYRLWLEDPRRDVLQPGQWRFPNGAPAPAPQTKDT